MQSTMQSTVKSTMQSTDTKENLIKTIKEWVKIDNEIRELQKQQSIRKVEKKKISETLIEIMRKNEIDCFDINDGQIVYNKKSVKKPITKKILFDILSKYYKGDSNKAEDILENKQNPQVIAKAQKNGSVYIIPTLGLHEPTVPLCFTKTNLPNV